MIGAAEEKSQITAIPNKYKMTLNDFIDSLDTKFPDYSNSPNRLRLIDKKSRNTPKFRSGLLTFFEGDYLNKNVLITLLELTL